MMLRLLSTICLILTALGCDQLSVMPGNSSAPGVISLSTYTAQSGETVNATGIKLDSTVKLTIDDEGAELIVADKTLASFVYPGSKTPVSRVAFYKDGQLLAQFPLVNKELESSISVSDVPADQLCSDIIVKNTAGEIVKGQAKCEEPTVACESDGQKNCLANEAFANADFNNLASKVLSGETVAGVAGTVPHRSANCTSDGQGGCIVDGAQFKSVPVAALQAADFRSGLQIGGVSGEILTSAPACLSDGQTLCLTTSNFPAVDKAYIQANAASFDSTQTLLGVGGTLSDCTSDGQTACVVHAPQFVNVMKTGAAAKIASGQTFGGIAGTGLSRPSDCSTDGQTACVTIATFPAVDKAVLSANLNKVSSTLNIAGSTGTIANCSSDGQSSCLAVSAFPAVDKTNLTSNAAKIRSGLSLASVAGSLADCSSDGALSCVTVTNFPALQKSGAAAKILAGQSLGGVSGTAPIRPADCSSDGGLACVTLANFPAMDISTSAPKILTGQTIAGVAGSALLRPDDCTSDSEIDCVSTVDVPAVEKARLTGAPEKFSQNLTIAGVTGTLLDCSVDGDQDCIVLGPAFKAANTVGLDAKLAAGKILAGVTGSAAVRPDDCSSDGQQNCSTTTAFPAMIVAGSAAKIVEGQTLAGVTGMATNYRPSDCASDGELGCTTITSFPAMDATAAIPNIASGDSLGGIAGTALVRPSDCTTDGAQSCVTNADYPSISQAFVTTNKALIKPNFTLIGISGTLALCSSEGALACETTAAYPAALFSGASAKILTGSSVGAIAGAAPVRPSDCNADGGISCVATSTYPAIQKSTIVDTKIRSGLSLGGVAGALNDCSSDGALLCFISTNYAAMNKGPGIEAKILNNEILGGVTGTGAGRPLDCAADGSTNCVAVTAFPAVSVADVTAAKGKIQNTLTIAGIPGELLDCSTDGGTSCTTIATYKSMDASGAEAKIAASEILGGITGSTATRPGDCSTDGGTACTTTSSYPSVDGVALAAKASKIVAGTSVAGVAGTLPVCAGDGVQGCATNSTYRSMIASGAGPKIYVNQTLGGVAGSAAVPPSACSLDNQNNCITSSTNPAVNKSNITTNAAKFTTALTMAGTIGTMAACSIDGGIDCYTTGSNPSANAANLLPQNIKNGTVIGGVTGAYPSTTYPLVGATGTVDLLASTMNAQLASTTNFEYFTPAGVRYAGAGTANLIPTNLRKTIFGQSPSYYPDCTADAEEGCVAMSPYKAVNVTTLDPWNFLRHKTLGGIQGKMVFPANGTFLVNFNRVSGNLSNASTTIPDIYDSTDDTTNAGQIYPTNAVDSPGWYVAGVDDIIIRDTTTDTNGNGSCDAGEACIYYDRNTKKKWARFDTNSGSWNDTIGACTLNAGSMNPNSGWRLPTLKDVQQAYIDGLAAKTSQLNMGNGFYFTSTTFSTTTANVWYSNPNNGHTPGQWDKTTGHPFFCVHD